jgi:hypothetical protein
MDSPGAAKSSPNLSRAESMALQIASETKAYLAALCSEDQENDFDGASIASNTPLDASAIQTRLMELTNELQFLIQGPRLYVHNQILSVSRFSSTKLANLCIANARHSM